MKIGLNSNTIADAARAAQKNTANTIASSTARLSSGKRIISASDDIASLSISTSIRTRLSGLRSAQNNVNQADSMLQIADQALNQITGVLQRQKELAVRASSGDVSDNERSFLSQEFRALTDEIQRIASSTNFNNIRFFTQTRDLLTLTQSNTEAFNAILSSTSLQVSGGGNAIRSNTPIQAFNSLTSASMAGTGAPGRLQLVDANGVLLANSAYATVNESVYGSFSSFKFSDIIYGPTGRGSATLTATLNGVEYTGRVVSAGTARVVLSSGDTHLNLNLGTVNLTDSGRASSSISNITDAFKTTVIARTNTIGGVNFFDTGLAGAIGTNTTSIANIRLTSGDAITIEKFEYLSNNGSANSNQIAVQVNGTTFIADNVRDLISGGTLQFRDEARVQVLSINLAGLDTNITNIRTRALDREKFIDALNNGFSAIRTGVDFALDGTAIQVGVNQITPQTLYDGQNIDVATTASAAQASSILDQALQRVNSTRANIGAAISRLNFANSVIGNSIQNQDAARAALADTDVASESTTFAQSITKAEFANYAIAQANKLPETLLDLLNES